MIKVLSGERPTVMIQAPDPFPEAAILQPQAPQKRASVSICALQEGHFIRYPAFSLSRNQVKGIKSFLEPISGVLYIIDNFTLVGTESFGPIFVPFLFPARRRVLLSAVHGAALLAMQTDGVGHLHHPAGFTIPLIMGDRIVVFLKEGDMMGGHRIRNLFIAYFASGYLTTLNGIKWQEENHEQDKNKYTPSDQQGIEIGGDSG
ncbi:MAG TPA: hypothetical protein PLG50_14415, partial [bacterium]|nr:hypothetical protein [bacterium]